MKKSFDRLVRGYKDFREKYAQGDHSVMRYLARNGQAPKIMVIACCDSRVDPALILQADPGELFVVRNVANIVPPYEKDDQHHGTSAALEFGINFLKVEHLILLGHSQCGGIEALLNSHLPKKDDFITNWVTLLKGNETPHTSNVDEYAQATLLQSCENCMTFPWIREKVLANQLQIHVWFFDINPGEILTYYPETNSYHPLVKEAE